MGEKFCYKNGYTFKELQEMAELFDDIRLPFLNNYNVKNLLGEYVFGLSMNRFPVGIKHTIRRFLGGLFEPKIITRKKGNNLFVFSGDGNGRPDYVKCLNKVVKQCDNTMTIVVDRKKMIFKPWRLYSVFLEIIWAVKLNTIVKKFNIGFDMAVALFRADILAKRIYNQTIKYHLNTVTVFCDAWAIENALVQLFKKHGIKTATLQHGNGTDIFLGSCSHRYLANSLLSKQNAVNCGVPLKRISVLGPMKYAGEEYDYQAYSLNNIGIVFDGAQNLDNNLEMIDVIHKAINGQKCYIRFHPNNNRADYEGHILPSDIISDSLEEFENTIDLCIVYNSSMFTDMIYKRIPVIRYKNGKVDLFPEIQDKGFSSKEELVELLNEYNEQSFRLRQNDLYNIVFGSTCGKDSYRKFYKSWGSKQ